MAIISFDDYLQKAYQRRLKSVRERRELASIQQAGAFGLSLDEYIANINAAQKLVEKDSAVDFDDLPPWVLKGISSYQRSSFEKKNVRCDNIRIVSYGLDTLYGGGNYGVVIVGNQEDLRIKVETDLRVHPEVCGVYEIEEPNEVKNLGIGNFDDGKFVRSNGMQTQFGRATTPHSEEGKDAIERYWEGQMDPSGLFFVRQMDCDPRNLITIAMHGTRFGTAEVIKIMANYVKKERLLAHFDEAVKPNPNWPGVLYDPRAG